MSEITMLRGLLWYAWYEMNAIRARDGAPDGVNQEYWDNLVSAFAASLGEDAKPWPSEDARSVQEEYL